MIIHLRGHQTRQRIAEQRRKLEYAQTQPIQQIIHRKRRDRREQVFENDRVNADGVAHGVEMAAGIIVDINRFNRHFDHAELHIPQLEQHIHFVFIPFAVDGDHRGNGACGQAAQTGLRIRNMHTAGQRIHKAGDPVAPAALERHVPGELA